MLYDKLMYLKSEVHCLRFSWLSAREKTGMLQNNSKKTNTLNQKKLDIYSFSHFYLAEAKRIFHTRRNEVFGNKDTCV